MPYSRALLHLRKLDQFAAFAECRGWKREAPRAAYEVLRLRSDRGVLSFYARASATEHATIPWGGEAMKLWKAYARFAASLPKPPVLRALACPSCGMEWNARKEHADGRYAVRADGKNERLCPECGAYGMPAGERGKDR